MSPTKKKNECTFGSYPLTSMNVTLFGQKVFADVIKMRSHGPERALLPWLVSSPEEGRLDTDAEENTM